MSRGFHADEPNRGGAPFRTMFAEAAQSVAFQPGDACEVASSVLNRINSQTDVVFGIFQDLKVPASLRSAATKYTSTTLGERALYLPAQGLVYCTYLEGADAPLINGSSTTSTVQAGSTASAVKVNSPFGGGEAAGDFDLGVIFVGGEQRTIASGAFAAGVYTFTLNKALSNTPTTGAAVYAVSLNVGMKPKFSATAPYRGISTAIADISGGKFLLREVNLDPKASAFGPFVRGEFTDY